LNDEGLSGQLEELDKLFKESFPDIRCLRCENDEFYILPSSRQPIVSPDGVAATTTIPVMTVACTRCGHIEQHLIPTLRDAAKPIELNGPMAS
jgi:predicted nucleic-acid-binding Zn-ribbon protein